MRGWLEGAVSLVTGAPPSSPSTPAATPAPTPSHPEADAPPPANSTPTSPFASILGAVKGAVEGAVDTLNSSMSDVEAPTAPAPAAPWELPGPGNEARSAALKAQILNLSREKWNFMQAPQDDVLVGFRFSMDEYAPLAQECLRLDPELEKMRWLLVPWKIKEEPFWRNYFGHVHAVKRAILASDDTIALVRAAEADHEGHRTLVPAAAPVLDAELAAVLGPDEADGDEDIVIALSSIDGLSLEDQINAALNDEL